MSKFWQMADATYHEREFIDSLINSAEEHCDLNYLNCSFVHGLVAFLSTGRNWHLLEYMTNNIENGQYRLTSDEYSHLCSLLEVFDLAYQEWVLKQIEE